MTEDGPRRISLARRESRGRALLSDWLERFNSVTGTPLSPGALLSLDATEQLKRAFVNHLRSGEFHYREWPTAQKDDLLGFLRGLSRHVGSLDVVLFSDVDEYIGAARVRTDAVLEHPMRLWEFVGNDLALATPDLSSGLCVEMNYYTSEGEYNRDGIYSVTGWGAFGVTPV
jgi:hypothetical protein